MGGGEVVRYMRNYEGARVNKIALISSVTPFLIKTHDNPDGVDKSVFEQMQLDLHVDRPAFITEFAKQFFGVNWISSPVSDPMLAATCEEAMQASARATLACVKAFSETDFRDDLPTIAVPTLVIHGDADETIPIEASGKKPRDSSGMLGSSFILTLRMAFSIRKEQGSMVISRNLFSA